MFAVALASATVVSLRHPAVPEVHDEFSYLLAADTFAHGRLANPPLALARHFETFHVLQQPTYVSKYPPLQGLVLAFGQVVLGRALAGAWLAFALACAASAWMLRAWVAPAWALGGGLALAVHPQLVVSWGTLYWGGALPLLGASLVYGALPRILERPRVADGALLGLGASVLALSRPFEGLVAALPMAAWLAVRVARARPRFVASLRALAPAALALACAAAFLALYDARTTGSATTMPYQLDARANLAVPLFLFQERPSPAPTYAHPVLASFYGGWIEWYEKRRTLAGFLASLGEVGAVYGKFFVGYALLPIALGVRGVVARRELRVLFLTLPLIAFALLAQTFSQPHYAAAFVPAVLVLAVAALQELASWRFGMALVATILLAGLAEHVGHAQGTLRRRAECPLVVRPQMIAKLAESGGKHLVLVRYEPSHFPDWEFVYNGAELAEESVVWAREMRRDQNAELLRAFPDRKAWLFAPDSGRFDLRPYAPDDAPGYAAQ